VFSFILEKANGKQIRGEYIPTEKNGLVRALYKTLGFEKVTKTQNNNNNEQWVYANYNSEKSSPKHYASINEI